MARGGSCETCGCGTRGSPYRGTSGGKSAGQRIVTATCSAGAQTCAYSTRTTTVSSFARFVFVFFFFFQAEDGIRDYRVTGVQTCALPILPDSPALRDANPTIVLIPG